MKDYLWIIVAGTFALVAFIYFIMTIATSSTLIKKLKKKKAHILLNVAVLIIGLANIGIGFYLLQDIRHQIEVFSKL
ncbi:hypothetical protein [Vagococcus hydrophili]|uniref:Uncharacterized protein n=1 Tax=Vagococcus hydrophili TaxID=2714947 RepID=A0A6G8ATH2_9ENTE|nr:hypothetical protein [Vagococcus hydrophili]QIL48235.1 hypothetical protein G7082_06895 [Vagococcus hydrophili]